MSRPSARHTRRVVASSCMIEMRRVERRSPGRVVERTTNMRGDPAATCIRIRTQGDVRPGTVGSRAMTMIRPEAECSRRSAPRLTMLAVGLLLGCGTPVEPISWDSPLSWPTHRITVDPDVRLGARFEWQEDHSITFMLTAANPTGEDALLETGPCPFRVRAYRTVELVEPAVWESLPASPTPCHDEGLVLVLPPGQSDVFPRTYRRAQMAMGLPAGKGYFALLVAKNGVRDLLPAGGFLSTLRGPIHMSPAVPGGGG